MESNRVKLKLKMSWKELLGKTLEKFECVDSWVLAIDPFPFFPS